MLEGKYIFIQTPLLICAIILAYISINCAGSKVNSTESLDGLLTSNPYEQITGQIEYYGRLRTKRSFPMYTCNRKSCDENGCRPETYHGPHPPKWCQRNPHKKETQCSWTKSCQNKRCTTQSTKCRQEFQEFSNGRVQPKSTFNFECVTRLKKCYVEECKGFTNCGKRTTISMAQFENDFVKALPRCDEVDNQNKRKERETIGSYLDNELLVSRKIRAPAAFLALKDYCCEVGERWGVKLAHVRPIIG